MLTLLLFWLAAGVAIAAVSGRSSAGLPLAYFLGLSLIHVPGAIIHLDAEGWDPTRLGFEQTMIGIVAFVIAIIIARPFLSFFSPDRNMLGGRYPTYYAILDRLALLYCAVGGFTYFVLMSFTGAIGSATAVLSSLGSLIVIGPCFRLWVAVKDRNRFKFWSIIACLPVLLVFALVETGFLGYGIFWVIGISSFVFAQSGRRILHICLAPLLFFVALSVFVNYMAARHDIRKLVWYQPASFADRVQRVADVFRNFEWLNFTERKQRWAIDDRLNQNFIDGNAVSKLRDGSREYASGATISDVIVSLIPRALWPEKPAVGGGGDVVTKYTGIRYARGTSVGAGQVLEFFVNFGTWGVIGGFLIYGLLLGLLDLLTIRYLCQGDQRRCLLVFMIGVSLLQPGGNLAEIVVAAAGSVVAAFGVTRFVQQRWGAVGLHTLQHKRGHSMLLEES